MNTIIIIDKFKFLYISYDYFIFLVRILIYNHLNSFVKAFFAEQSRKRIVLFNIFLLFFYLCPVFQLASEQLYVKFHLFLRNKSSLFTFRNICIHNSIKMNSHISIYPACHFRNVYVFIHAAVSYALLYCRKYYLVYTFCILIGNSVLSSIRNFRLRYLYLIKKYNSLPVHKCMHILMSDNLFYLSES